MRTPPCQSTAAARRSTREWFSVSLDERERLIRDLGEKNIMMLWNHGVLTAGKTVPEAFIYLYFFTRACEIQGRAGNGPHHLPDQAAIDTTREQGQMLGGAAKLAWPGLVRLADTHHPGFRE
ncbi:class II aldolase/adducin family protein [Aquisalimonas lutea]|uniref:class II aldolase/adducin family protein n=1 Tax=Aquisalimonas lutea TaxID=1327750 RepID=UPI0025B55052|nr:class II aldolase/adducin family protein [Aquisalimonas lutea]MDN3518791.1 class II aldolase/adducin family protein [Aquisalimonas lutea]